MPTASLYVILKLD